MNACRLYLFWGVVMHGTAGVITDKKDTRIGKAETSSGAACFSRIFKISFQLLIEQKETFFILLCPVFPILKIQSCANNSLLHCFSMYPPETRKAIPFSSERMCTVFQKLVFSDVTRSTDTSLGL